MDPDRPMPDENPSVVDRPEVDWNQLARRLGPDRLARRLAVQIRHSAHLLRLIPPRRYLETPFFLKTVILTALRLAGLQARARRNYLDIRITVRDLPLPNLDPIFEHYTLLHLSDLHADLDPAFIPALIDRIQPLAFDTVVITGDFRSRTYGDPRPCLRALAELARSLNRPITAVLGNHDAIEMAAGLEALGLTVLLNEAIVIRRGPAAFGLAGIDDPHTFKTHDIPRARAAIPAGLPALLLSHSAEVFHEAEAAGFDALLCGHTHAGQICLPGGIPLIRNSPAPLAFFTGPWRYRRMRGYTSSGTGASGIPVRLNTRPEAVLHRLRRG